MDQWLGLLRSLAIYHNPVTLWAWRGFYREILSPGDLVFDVGAHVGTRARAMRRAGAHVVALEPQRLFTRYLRLTLPKDIVLIEAAAGKAADLAQMAVSSRHPTVSSLKAGFVTDAAEVPGFAHVRWDKTEAVRVITLDSLITEHGLPAYIKIDVEGFELEVLSGLSHAVPMISVEYLPGFQDLTLAVLERLDQLGHYQFNPVRGERGGFLWQEWRDSAALRDWLASLPADAPSGDLFARLAV
ncbi:MAG: FkbM family methyltransferase [Roseinatronobacter sp.]|nr:FkbM family methyltransferase [Roseinatronobacter sp.]